MKLLSTIILAIALTLTFASCSQASPSGTNNENAENNSAEHSTEIGGVFEEPSKQEIYNSVSSIIGDELLYDEELSSRYNFTDKNTGYFFQFDIINNQNKLVYLLKTQDGGKTWESQNIQSAPSIGWREYIICSKMINENVGLISGQYWADANFSDHTYITTDGGKNWTKVALPKDSPYVYSEDSSDTVTYLEGEACDLTYENGVYFLHVRAYTSEEVYPLYSSTDLVSWTYVGSGK